MIDLDPATLSELLSDALRYRTQHTEMSAGRIRKYAGRRLRSDWSIDGDAHENYAWEFVVNTLPGLFHNAPKIEVSSDFRGDPMLGGQIELGELAMNGWLEKSEAGVIMARIALDMMFDFGVGMIKLDDLPGAGDDPKGSKPTPVAPRLYRVSPRRFLVDPTANCFENARFCGHIWSRDLADMAQAIDIETGQPMFNEEALGQCVLDPTSQDLIDPEAGDPNQQARRNRIWGVELFVPEHQAIMVLGLTTTITTAGSAATVHVVPLCQPREYYGPRRGPYQLFGLHWIPDQVLPLPPLAITEEEEDELNKQLGQISDDAGVAKRIIVNSGDPEGGKKITTSLNGQVINIPGAGKDTVFPIEFPGAQAANVEHSMRLMERLDRKGGLTQADRGRVSPDVTATAEAAAAAGSTRREAYQKLQFRLCAASLLERALWFFHESDQVRWDVLVPDPMMPGMKTVRTMSGGPMPGLEQLHLPFEALRLNIEPMTMEFEDDAIRQRRLEGFFAGMVNFVGLAQEGPYWKIENIIDDWAEAFNLRGASDRYIDLPMFRQFQQMQLMLGTMQAGASINAEQAKAQPKSGKENGGGAVNPVRERAAMLAEARRG